MAIAEGTGSQTGSGSMTTAQFIEVYLDALMMAESGGKNVNNYAGDSTASGYFQYIDGTWGNYGGYSRAIHAPYEVQRERARKDALAAYRRFGGDIERMAMSHYYPAWADKPKSTWNQSPTPDIPNNPTGWTYVQKLTSQLDESKLQGVDLTPPPPGSPAGGDRQPGDPDQIGPDDDTRASGTWGPEGPTGNPYDQGGATAGFGSETAAGQGGGAAADTDASGVIEEDELRAHIQRTYPQMTWALEDEELGPILRRAAEESWDKARLYGALVQTNFWKNHPDRDRILINTRENDPATYRQMLDQEMAKIQDLGYQLGWAGLRGERLERLATESMHSSWSQQQIQDRLIQDMPLNLAAIEAGDVGGRMAEVKQNLDAVANDYMIHLADNDKKRWIQRIMRGQVDESAFAEHAQRVAIGQYPWLAEAMERGVTPRQFTDPYREWIAQSLETSPETIDMTDHRYQQVLYDQEQARVRTLPEVNEYVRKYFGEWRTTRQANEQFANVNQTLLQTFGKVAG